MPGRHTTPRNASRPDRSTASGIKTFMSGGVRLRRTPVALARRFFQIVTDAASEAIAAEGVKPQHLAALVVAQQRDRRPRHRSERARRAAGLERARVSQLVDEIEGLGLIDRRVNGADRRARLLRLTPQGEHLRARVHPKGLAAQTRVLAGLPPADRELLLDLLIRVIQLNSAPDPPAAVPGASKRHDNRSPRHLKENAMRHVLRTWLSDTLCSSSASAGCTVLAATVASIGNAAAQTFPSRPITIIVPFPAGGPADTLARIMAERMRVSLGQPVIIENVTGASGSIGTGRVARAAPDGYTLSLGNWPRTSSTARSMRSVRCVNDFEPVALLVDQPQLIVAKKTMPANDLKELIAWLKANPDKASQGTSGVGSTIASRRRPLPEGNRHALSVRALSRRRPAMQDLVAGQIDLMIDQAANSLPQVRAGSIKAYAVTAKSRLAAAPDIPTVDEAGLPGLLHLDLVCALGAQGHAEGRHRQAQCRGRGCAWPIRRCAQRLADLGQEIPPREQQTPEALARLPEGRDREVVADHQGGEHQGGVRSTP